jgi:hypothetical protein
MMLYENEKLNQIINLAKAGEPQDTIALMFLLTLVQNLINAKTENQKINAINDIKVLLEHKDDNDV